MVIEIEKSDFEGQNRKIPLENFNMLKPYPWRTSVPILSPYGLALLFPTRILMVSQPNLVAAGAYRRLHPELIRFAKKMAWVLLVILIKN